MDLNTLQQLVQAHGLWLLVPASIVEGPIVTVIASYMASLGLLNIYAVYVICVLGDLLGDTILYCIGRFAPKTLPGRWQVRLGLSRSRRKSLRCHYHDKGGKTLMIGKLTHAASAPVLVAAGAAKMNYLSFIGWNTLATLPKTLVFTIVGYVFGYAYATIDNYIFRGSIILLGLTLVVGGIWYYRRRNRAANEEEQEV